MENWHRKGPYNCITRLELALAHVIRIQNICSEAGSRVVRLSRRDLQIIIIIIDRFYMALFSALSSRLTALVCDST